LNEDGLYPEITIPKAFKCIFEPKRYKVFYGGRGGAKSHNIARYLLIMGMNKPMRFLCARELQGSITDSVHKLLSDIIDMYGLGTFYDVQKATIKGKNGTEFFFKGLKHNATEIKSMEGVDKVWVEEAEKVSARSWEILIPTIRKEGSEILVSFNPKHPTDPTYITFVANADEHMLVKRVSWRDNPFFPDTLELERKRLQISDPKAYKHVWEGEFDERHFGGIYASYIEDARHQGRICPAPYKAGVPVITAWDLGKSDSTAIWFAQVVGLQVRIINYYDNNQEDLEHYADYIKSLPYKCFNNYLPHDAAHERLGMKSGSIAKQLKDMGIPNKILPVGSIAARIEAGRTLLKECYIDDNNCKEGIHALLNYQYEWDENKNMFKKAPLHDWASDPADGFGYLAQVLAKEGLSSNKPTPQARRPVRVGSWMG
jgi:phage terminase large subunit